MSDTTGYTWRRRPTRAAACRPSCGRRRPSMMRRGSVDAAISCDLYSPCDRAPPRISAIGSLGVSTLWIFGVAPKCRFVAGVDFGGGGRGRSRGVGRHDEQRRGGRRPGAARAPVRSSTATVTPRRCRCANSRRALARRGRVDSTHGASAQHCRSARARIGDAGRDGPASTDFCSVRDDYGVRQ